LLLSCSSAILSKRKDLLVWLDLEMTGLDPERHAIIEIGCALTDSNLKVIAEGPSLAIYQPARVLAKMDSWCVRQHGQSGLTQRVKESRISLAQAERQTLSFLKRYCAPQSSPLCGNSIGQDRRFLYKYMPLLNDFFHYRNVDVSSIKELVNRWYSARFKAPEKAKTHQVMDDLYGSIAELRHYRKVVFR
jgi:oligoribonuclease